MELDILLEQARGKRASARLARLLASHMHGPNKAHSGLCRRLGSQGRRSQFSVLQDLEAKSDRIQRALDYAKRNLQKDLSVEELAKAARLSIRQFSRAFHAQTGQSPAKAVERLRVETARM